MALVSRYGRTEDAAAYSIMSIESGPFLTMVSLGVAGLSAFPWQTLVGSVLPLVCGMILGNIDFELREFLGRAVPVMIPFFAFALGGTLNLGSVATAGLLGIGLGLFVVVGSGIFLILTDRFTGGTGTAGLAAATTAGNAAAVPTLVAAANPAYANAGGKILIDGEPLEQTQFWSAKIPRPDFAAQMADVGLTMESLPLETVRRGKQEVRRTISELVGEGCTTILCDAEHEDLFQIAQAGFEIGPQCFFAGSGGLAKQLFKLFPPGDLMIPVPRKLSELILIAVGSCTTNSQTQFAKLRGVPGLRCFLLGPEELEKRSISQPELGRLLDCKQDLAVAINADAMFPDDIKPSHVLAGLLAPLLNRVGALVVTGGETCRGLLQWIGAQKLQLLDELEPGVSLAFVSAPRPLLVVVKAGGFGDPNTLQNAYRFLKKIRISHE